VSCIPVTFAPDAKILIDGGYGLGEVTPVDQFRYSAHAEIVARLAAAIWSERADWRTIMPGSLGQNSLRTGK
jgi:hypothetical protein